MHIAYGLSRIICAHIPTGRESWSGVPTRPAFARREALRSRLTHFSFLSPFSACCCFLGVRVCGSKPIRNALAQRRTRQIERSERSLVKSENVCCWRAMRDARGAFTDSAAVAVQFSAVNYTLAHTHTFIPSASFLLVKPNVLCIIVCVRYVYAAACVIASTRSLSWRSRVLLLLLLTSMHAETPSSTNSYIFLRPLRLPIIAN